MRLRWIVSGIAALALGVGVAGASHAPVVDPATIPVGQLAAHIDASLDIAPLARAIKKHRADLFVQHFRLAPNSAFGWHTHPGPAIISVVKGSFGYQEEVRGECVTTWYPAGTGLMDRGFGHVHRAVSRDDGFDVIVTFVTPSGTANQTIPTAPPAACS
jgi:hypothetical protein